MVLRKYHDFITRHFPQNTKKFLFFGRKNMKPIAYEGMKTKLQTAMTRTSEEGRSKAESSLRAR